MPHYYTYNQIYIALQRYRVIYLTYVNENYPIENTVDEIRIYRPKLNSNISECLVRRLYESQLLNDLNFPNLRFATDRGDLVFDDGNITKTVEVKSTGSQAFSFFSQRDLDANFIIWVHFEQFLEIEQNAIVVYVIPKMNDNLIALLPGSHKINLDRFLILLGNNNHAYSAINISLNDNGATLINI